MCEWNCGTCMSCIRHRGARQFWANCDITRRLVCIVRVVQWPDAAQNQTSTSDERFRVLTSIVCSRCEPTPAKAHEGENRHSLWPQLDRAHRLYTKVILEISHTFHTISKSHKNVNIKRAKAHSPSDIHSVKCTALRKILNQLDWTLSAYQTRAHGDITRSTLLAGNAQMLPWFVTGTSDTWISTQGIRFKESSVSSETLPQKAFPFVTYFADRSVDTTMFLSHTDCWASNNTKCVNFAEQQWTGRCLMRLAVKQQQCCVVPWLVISERSWVTTTTWKH